METNVAEPTVYWPFWVYAGAVFAVVGGMLGFSSLLGQRSKGRVRDTPYESGILATGTARIRVTADFYLFAMFFVIFDIEAVFVFLWAIAVPELGWAGYAQISVFVGTVVAALIYLWRLGALDPDAPGR